MRVRSELPQFLPSSYRRYAVDFDGDGKRDLWNHAGRHRQHRELLQEPTAGCRASRYWRRSSSRTDPISDEFKALVERGINPQTTVAAIKRAGGSPAYIVADDMKAAVFAAETDAGTRHWIGFNNFYVITRYNRSVNYALAVYELAQELRGLRTAQRAE